MVRRKIFKLSYVQMIKANSITFDLQVQSTWNFGRMKSAGQVQRNNYFHDLSPLLKLILDNRGRCSKICVFVRFCSFWPSLIIDRQIFILIFLSLFVLFVIFLLFTESCCFCFLFQHIIGEQVECSTIRDVAGGWTPDLSHARRVFYHYATTA